MSDTLPGPAKACAEILEAEARRCPSERFASLVRDGLAESPFRVGAAFRSNNGRGKQRAVIVDVCGSRARLSFVRTRRASFVLPLWFLSSPACGWKAEERRE